MGRVKGVRTDFARQPSRVVWNDYREQSSKQFYNRYRELNSVSSADYGVVFPQVAGGSSVNPASRPVSWGFGVSRVLSMNLRQEFQRNTASSFPPGRSASARSYNVIASPPPSSPRWVGTPA